MIVSSAAKKASCSHPEASTDKGEVEKKEGLNGEVEEEANGKAKEGDGAACSSKLRTCRAGGGEGSSTGTSV